MEAFLSDLLRVSFQGGIVILAVAALRLILKNAPRRTLCLLWLLAGLRLLLPFQIESSLSLQPEVRPENWGGIRNELSVPALETGKEGGWGEILNEQGEVIVSKPLGTGGWGEILDSEGNTVAVKPLMPNVYPNAEEKEEIDWNSVISAIWLLGAAAMGISSVAAYLGLKKKVSGAVILSEGVWVAGNIDTAFVLGFFRPQIYLPLWLEETEREFVLDHERSHIARHDQWWKLLGYVTLSLHWFNPLVWLGYALLCRDLEMACDENVVKSMDLARRKAYSAALVSGSTVHRSITACPVAFGEVSVKERVKNVLNYRKPGFWITMLAAAAAVFVAVFLLTSPSDKPKEILRAGYTGPKGEYTNYHTDERAARWEADVLYLAEKLLTEHPYVTDDDFYIYSGLDCQEVELSNGLYDASLRADVIDQVDKLIPKLAEMNDGQILLEMQRIMASLGDPGTEMYLRGIFPERIPLYMEAIYEEGTPSVYAFRVPKANENLLYGKLIAMNGVPIEKVLGELAPYVSGENTHWAVMEITTPYLDSFLYQKLALQVIGLVDKGEDSVELTFETEQGTQTAQFPFLTVEEEDGMEFVGRLRVDPNQIPYRGMMSEYYWYDILEEENALYMHIYQLWQNTYKDIYFDRFLIETTSHLQNAQEPMTLVIDLRFTGNGAEFQDAVNSFIGRVNRLENDGVYILVDSTTHSTGVHLAYRLQQGIRGAKLVGSPTGTGANLMGGASVDAAPNCGTSFWVQNTALMPDPEYRNTLHPDVLIYQTLEDYKNGVDTVFEAAVNGLTREFDISLGTVTMKEDNLPDIYLGTATVTETKPPVINMEDAMDVTEWGKDATVRMIGANRVLIQDCIQALETLQNRETVHLTAEAAFEGVPGETGSFQEYWQSGEDWLRIGQQQFEDPLNNYTVGNLSVGDSQYRFGHAGTHPVGGREWTPAEEAQLWHRYWLMDFDLSQARILSLEKWDTEEGYAVRMELGRKTDTGVYGTNYRRIHTYYLDWQGNLLRLVEDAVDDPITVNNSRLEKHLTVDIRILDTAGEDIAAVLVDAGTEILQ